MINYFLEDCRQTIKDRNLPYHYIICSPPDFGHIGLKPTDYGQYYQFLESVFVPAKPINSVMTIILTDRKAGGMIHPKHSIVTKVFADAGYRLLSQKIWVKSFKMNMFRLTYTFCLTFAKGKIKQNKCKEYQPDVFYIPFQKVGDYLDNFNLELLYPFINTFTNEDDIVYDPFMGSGSSAIASLQLKRQYLGSEIEPKIYEIGKTRIENQLKGN